MSDDIVTAYFGEISDPQLEYLFWLGMPQDRRLALIRTPGTNLDAAALEFTVDAVGILITDNEESNTGITIDADQFNDMHCRIEVWLLRTRCEGLAPAYEEIFHPKTGIWRASVMYLEAMPQDKRSEALLRLAPGIVLLSRVGQEVNFVDDAGYGGYTREQLIANNLGTIERMAQQQKDTAEIKPFSVNDFRKNYPIAMGRSSIYNYVRRQDWLDLERRYAERCRELRGEK